MRNFPIVSGKDLGGLGEVEHFNMQFNDFELVYFDSPWKDNEEMSIEKEWYLVGVDVKKESKDCKFSDPEILISLINLSSKIVASNGLHDENDQEDELSFSEDIKEWCKKYGLPYEEDYFSKNYHKGKGEIPPKFGFRLWEFKSRIVQLHNRFNLWYGLTFNDLKRVIKYSSSYELDFKNDLDIQVSSLKEHLAYHVWGDMQTDVAVQYNKTTDTYEIVPYTSSLLAVAYFQFAMLMTSKGMKGVKFCSMCNKLFEIEHGATKMCDNCKREYHRIKTQESRMKNGTKQKKPK